MVEVFAAEEGVAVGRKHFKLFFAVQIGNFDDGNIEGAAAQVVYGDFAVAFGAFVHTESQCSCGGLVDDAFHIQTGDAACVFSGLALAVVEIGRHGNHCCGYFFAQIGFGGFFHFAQHFGGNLRRRKLFALCFHPSVAVFGFHDFEGHQIDVFLHFFVFKFVADQAFYRVDGVFRVGNSLAFGRCAHEDFAAVQIGDNGGSGACAFGVFDYFSLAVFGNGQAGIGGTQIDTDNFCHNRLLLRD